MECQLHCPQNLLHSPLQERATVTWKKRTRFAQACIHLGFFLLFLFFLLAWPRWLPSVCRGAEETREELALRVQEVRMEAQGGVSFVFARPHCPRMSRWLETPAARLGTGDVGRRAWLGRPPPC